MSHPSPHLQNTGNNGTLELQQNSSGSDTRNNTPSLSSVMSASPSTNNGLSDDKRKAFQRAYVDGEDSDDSEEWEPPSENDEDSLDSIKDSESIASSTDVDSDEDDNEEYLPPRDVGTSSVGGVKSSTDENDKAKQTLAKHSESSPARVSATGAGAVDIGQLDSDDSLEDDDEEISIAKRTRRKQKVVEDDAFFDQLLPDEEDEFDFGIVDEDEEYERFRSFLADPQLADDSLSDSDDDDYAPDKDEELENDSDNEEEEKRIGNVSKRELSSLIDDVRNFFEDDLSGLQTIVQSQQVQNKEKERRGQMSTEIGRRYLERLTENTRRYLHILLYSFVECRYNMDIAPSRVTYRQVKIYNTLFEKLLELDKMYHGRLISSNTRGGSRSRSLLRKDVKQRKRVASKELSIAKRRAKVLGVPGLHLIPALLRICPKSIMPKDKKRRGSSASSTSRASQSKVEKSKYIQKGENCYFEHHSQQVKSKRRKDISLWIMKYKPFEVYTDIPIRYGPDENNVVANANGVNHFDFGRHQNTKGGNADKTNSKARYAVVDAYPPPKEQLKRKQREFTLWEDDLLLLGLKKFGYTNGSFEKIQESFLPGFTKNGIRKYFNDIVHSKISTATLSTKSLICKWYEARKRAHDNWTEEETIHLVQVFWPHEHGSVDEKIRLADAYVKEFQKKYPARSQKSIKNKINRIKRNQGIPKCRADIVKEFSRRKNQKNKDKVSSTAGKLSLQKPKKKTKGKITAEDRRKSLLESEKKSAVQDSRHNREISHENYFGLQLPTAMTQEVGGATISHLPDFYAHSMNRSISHNSNDGSSLKPLGAMDKESSRQNSYDFSLNNTLIGGGIPRFNSLGSTQGNFLSAIQGSALQFSNTSENINDGTNSSGKQVGIGPTTFAGAMSLGSTLNNRSNDGFDEGGELGFDNGGQLDDVAEINDPKKRKVGETDFANILEGSSKRSCVQQGHESFLVSDISNASSLDGGVLQSNEEGLFASQCSVDESSRFFVRRSK